MSSPPPTPTEGRRFVDNCLPMEWIESYRPGGHHPVDLEDLFKDGRYKVIRKLGYGGHSIVWLTRDLEYVSLSEPTTFREEFRFIENLVDPHDRQNRYAALKVVSASATPDNAEDLIFERLGDSVENSHVTAMYDHFEIEGPNGTHRCLVYEPMGSCASAMYDPQPWYTSPYKRQFPLNIAREVIRQALKGVEFLHSNGFVHGDLGPSNMLFSTTDLTLLEEKDLWQPHMQLLVEDEDLVVRLDGKVDRWAPKRLYYPFPLTEFTQWREGEFTVKIGDFGSSFPLGTTPEKMAIPYLLRAPEVILGCEVDGGVDIWCLGCLLFEFVMGVRLIGNECYGRDELGDGCLLDIIDLVGPLPDHLMQSWPRAHIEFPPEQEQAGRDHGETPEAEPAAGPVSRQAQKVEESSLSFFPDIFRRLAKFVTNCVRGLFSFARSILGTKPQAQQEEDKAEGLHKDEEGPHEEEEIPPPSRISRDSMPTIEEFVHSQGSHELMRIAGSNDLSNKDLAELGDVLRFILVPDPSQRPTATEILAHPYFAGTEASNDERQNTQEEEAETDGGSGESEAE